MDISIPNLIQIFTTLDLGKQGYDRVLNAVTDLPIEVEEEGFNAENLDNFVREIAKLVESGGYDRATIHHKKNGQNSSDA